MILEHSKQWVKWGAFISIAHWEGEIVIFHHQTGETHLFSGFGAQVIERSLAKESFEIDELVDETSVRSSGQENLAPLIEQIISDLIRKHLIVTSLDSYDQQ